MNKYAIDTGTTVHVRHAETAQAAAEKLCNQYNWGYRLKMYDADTRGREWAIVAVDTSGGINYNCALTVTRAQ